MTPDQEANDDNFGIFVFELLDKNGQFHYQISKFPFIFVFTSYRKNCVGTQNAFE